MVQRHRIFKSFLPRAHREFFFRKIHGELSPSSTCSLAVQLFLLFRPETRSFWWRLLIILMTANFGSISSKNYKIIESDMSCSGYLTHFRPKLEKYAWFWCGIFARPIITVTVHVLQNACSDLRGENVFIAQSLAFTACLIENAQCSLYFIIIKKCSATIIVPSENSIISKVSYVSKTFILECFAITVLK